MNLIVHTIDGKSHEPFGASKAEAAALLRQLQEENAKGNVAFRINARDIVHIPLRHIVAVVVKDAQAPQE